MNDQNFQALHSQSEEMMATHPTDMADFFKISFIQPQICHPVAAESLNVPSAQTSSTDLLKNIPATALTNTLSLTPIAENVHNLLPMPVPEMTMEETEEEDENDFNEEDDDDDDDDDVDQEREDDEEECQSSSSSDQNEPIHHNYHQQTYTHNQPQPPIFLASTHPVPIKPKSHKKTKPTRSLPPTNLPQTTYEKEIAGILQLNVYTHFRNDPASLLITMEDDDDDAGSGSGGAMDEDEYDQMMMAPLQTRSGALVMNPYNSGVPLGSARRGSSGSSVYDSNTTLVNGMVGGASGMRNRNGKRRCGESGSGQYGFGMEDRMNGGCFGSGYNAVDRNESGSSAGSPKRRRTSSPTKPMFSSWSGLGSGIGAVKDGASKPSQAPIKYVPPSGEGGVGGTGGPNDKVRPLPFPLIEQELIDDYTQCKDPGDVVTWKKTPISFPEDMEGYSKLAPDEIETCSILRVPPADYIQVKNILLSARKHFDTFTKRQAQKWYGIDVNKTGKIFDWFVSKNWLVVSSKGKPKK
ncbi:hypothetical protein HDU79_003116 [Rhizoclosmatium sp. JEL0117]|nr:hypothetical protein HDU79_003116 [Rhizoclosmatium sp. JEL0117]